MRRFRVDPPAVREVPHGLLDVAEVVEREDAYWRTGIEYDTVACAQARLWGRWCTAAGMPSAPPDPVTITINLTGRLEDGLYSVLAAAEAEAEAGPRADLGSERQLTFVYYEESTASQSHGVADNTWITVGSGPAPMNGHLVITDVLTGASIDYNLVQDAGSGSLEHPVSPVVFVVPQAAVPEGCEQITTTFDATASSESGVDIAVSVTGAVSDELVVTVAGHRLVVAAEASPQTLHLASGVGEGTWPISVRDTGSGSLVSGWLYIDQALTGSATLVQATCPVKEIRSAPWQTLFAPAWTVYAEVECQSMAFDAAASAAREHLALAGHRAIEAAWWELAFARSRQIGTGVGLVEAIAELEHYIATNYSGLGLIHMPVYLAAWAGADDAVFVRDEGVSGTLHTLRGTPVVVGSGYPRQGDGGGAGVALMATGAVRLYTSGVEAVEVFDRRTNLRSAVAEQTVAAADDCLEPAVAYVDVGVART